MEFFEKKVIEDGFLEELQLLQRTMENWYNDKVLYHLILFTSTYAREKSEDSPTLNFKELLKQWKELYRKDFIRFLKKRIANHHVRNWLKENPDVILPPGGYKKIHCSWDICDYGWICTWEDYWNNCQKYHQEAIERG